MHFLVKMYIATSHVTMFKDQYNLMQQCSRRFASTACNAHGCLGRIELKSLVVAVCARKGFSTQPAQPAYKGWNLQYFIQLAGTKIQLVFNASVQLQGIICHTAHTVTAHQSGQPQTYSSHKPTTARSFYLSLPPHRMRSKT